MIGKICMHLLYCVIVVYTVCFNYKCLQFTVHLKMSYPPQIPSKKGWYLIWRKKKTSHFSWSHPFRRNFYHQKKTGIQNRGKRYHPTLTHNSQGSKVQYSRVPLFLVPNFFGEFSRYVLNISQVIVPLGWFFFSQIRLLRICRHVFLSGSGCQIKSDLLLLFTCRTEKS